MDPGTTRFGDVLLAETIRAIEETGPLEDAQVLRDAARTASNREDQVIARARLLAERIGLRGDLDRFAAHLWLAVLAAVIVVVALTWTLVASVLGEGRRINVVLAFVGVLGVHAASLLVWLIAALAPGGTGHVASLAKGLGGLTLWASTRARLHLGGLHGPLLVREGTRLLQRARLLPWAFGLINHGIWSAAFVLLLMVLYFTFAFRAYELTWETTILPREFFVAFIGWTAWLPAALHLPLADLDTLRVAGDGATNRRLAIWLLYCVLLYGLVPRLVLLIACRIVWRRARRSFTLDTADPYFRKLFNRLDHLRAPAIVDADAHERAASHLAFARSPRAGGGPRWIAFELPPEWTWPPGEAGAPPMERVAGDSAGRRRVVDRLAREVPGKVVFVCNGATSPDRGTARFFRDAAAHAGAAALLLVEPGADRPVNLDLWSAWLRSSGLEGLAVFTQLDAARAWGAASHG